MPSSKKVQRITIKKYIKILLFFFLLLPIFTMCSCTKKTANIPVRKTGFAFDTAVTITIYDDTKNYALEKCFELCGEYEKLFSATLENSEIWNINHSGGLPTDVSYDTARLIQSALFYCRETDGVLDLTLLPVSSEWDISGQMKTPHVHSASGKNNDYDIQDYYIPSNDTLSELLKHVNYRNVIIYDSLGNKVGCSDELSKDMQYKVKILDSSASIDLGFIAKGFIADELKSYLVSEGIESGIIALGGNIVLIGSKPNGSPFNIGIQKPFENIGETITTIKESDMSVVSSGCYERYFKKDGTVYHHIFDTTTGCPVQNDILGVTIISGSSLQGDALSTYCYILGLEKGLSYINSLNYVEAIFVTKDYKVVTSY